MVRSSSATLRGGTSLLCHCMRREMWVNAGRGTCQVLLDDIKVVNHREHNLFVSRPLVQVLAVAVHEVWPAGSHLADKLDRELRICASCCRRIPGRARVLVLVIRSRVWREGSNVPAVHFGALWCQLIQAYAQPTTRSVKRCACPRAKRSRPRRHIWPAAGGWPL